MIVDLPPDIQMAIRLRAIKDGIKTGKVVENAVREVFPDEMKEAEAVEKEKP